MKNLYKVNYNTTENRGASAPQNTKFNFKKMKDNTIKSLNEVEYFLCNFSLFLKYVKLYKILK